MMLVTRTIGVDPRLAEDAFYEEDYLRDVARVNAAFRRATALDSPVRVVRRRVRAGDIAAIVLNGAHACVALVDRIYVLFVFILNLLCVLYCGCELCWKYYPYNIKCISLYQIS